jgi:hypothetical protein
MRNYARTSSPHLRYNVYWNWDEHSDAKVSFSDECHGYDEHTGSPFNIARGTKEEGT